MKQFNKAKMVLRNGEPLEQLRFGRSKELALSSSTGEFNASDKKDLCRQIGELMMAASSGQIVEQHESMSASEERRELLAEAMADETGVKWASLGASIARQINEEMPRQGFLRRITVPNTLRQGEVARVPMPAHDSMAVIATSSQDVGYQLIRQRMFNPPEFEILADVRVENLDLEQVSGDLLEHAYNDGLQSIMVKEDRLWKQAADATVGTINPLEYISGELTTKNLGRLRQAVGRWNLPATTALIANDYWADIIGSNDFATMLDPITKYDLALTGQLGTLVGMTLITDAFKQPNQKVLDAGEIYIVSSPENHGAHTTRGGIRSTPTTGANQGNTTRGWLLSSPFSFVLANSRSVAKGRRI
jgi:hypothetical protein